MALRHQAVRAFKAFLLYSSNLRQLFTPAVYLLLLLAFGAGGYITLENFPPLDAIYMTVITITTVGFNEVHPLSNTGKIFTIGMILGGVIFYGLAIQSFLKVFIGVNFREYVEEARVNETLKKLKNHFIVCGGGRMALAICRELERSGRDFVILETNQDSPTFQLKKSESLNWLIIDRDALLEESLLEAGIERAAGLATVLPTDADNLFVVLSARKLNPALRIETRIAKESTREKMIQAGANKVISPYAVGGMQMARSLTQPDVDDFLEIVMDRASYEFEMKIHVIVPGDEVAGKTLRHSGFRKKGYIAIGIRLKTGRMIFAPSPDFKLEEGMEILLLGSEEEMPRTLT